MSEFFTALSDKQQAFITRQPVFFVATAAAGARINLSPKGLDCFRVLGPNLVGYLDVGGSGNETHAHLAADGRITIMFCAFEGQPLVLRLYGRAKVVHRGDSEWQEFFGLFPPLPGARQIFDVTLDLVQTSCGMAVPYLSYLGDRESLSAWAEKKGDEGLRRYREEKNQLSLDGIPTHIVDKEGH